MGKAARPTTFPMLYQEYTVEVFDPRSEGENHRAAEADIPGINILWAKPNTACEATSVEKGEKMGDGYKRTPIAAVARHHTRSPRARGPTPPYPSARMPAGICSYRY